MHVINVGWDGMKQGGYGNIGMNLKELILKGGFRREMGGP